MSQTAKKFSGKVISSKIQGVVTVEVARQKMHPLYQKSIKWTKKYHVRNSHSAQTGDTVEFIETRPISKTVKWETTRIIDTKSAPPTSAKTSNQPSATKHAPKSISKPKPRPKSKPKTATATK